MPVELQVNYGDEQVLVQRVARSGNANKVLIKVQPDGRVLAKAPVSASDAEVIAAVKKRLRWIFAQLRQFREQAEHVIPRNYVSGESHLYLGRRHLLKVFVSPDDKAQVKMLRATGGYCTGKVQREGESPACSMVQDFGHRRCFIDAYQCCYLSCSGCLRLPD